MARIKKGTLFVPAYTPTINNGEYTFTGATYANVSDVEGNGNALVSVGDILFVPAQNSGFTVSGVCHRYALTAVSAGIGGTLNGTILFDEAGQTEVDTPNDADTAIISEKGTGLGLGFPVSQQTYPTLAAGIDLCAYATDARNIIDKIVGTATKELTELRPAVTTTASGDLAFSGSGLVNDPLGAVIVTINGVEVTVGNASTSAACYFTIPANGTPKGTDAIVAGDVLRWNGTVAGYELATNDTILMTYEFAGAGG